MGALTGTLPKNTYGDLIQTGNAGAGVSATMKQVQDGLGNNTGLFLSTTQIGIAGTDVGMKRVAAAVAAMTDGAGTNLGWLQEHGYQTLASNFTRADTTLTALNFSFNVISGRTYQFAGFLFGGNSTSTEGLKFDFAGGAITATTFVCFAQVLSGTVAGGTQLSTSLAGVINWTTFTTTTYVALYGLLKPSSTGTFIMRAAENTTAAGTVTLNASSYLALTDALAV